MKTSNKANILKGNSTTSKDARARLAEDCITARFKTLLSLVPLILRIPNALDFSVSLAKSHSTDPRSPITLALQLNFFLDTKS